MERMTDVEYIKKLEKDIETIKKHNDEFIKNIDAIIFEKKGDVPMKIMEFYVNNIKLLKI